MCKKKKTILLYATPENYPLKCVFVYNFVSSCVSLFWPQVHCIIVCTCPYVCSKYCENVLFQNLK